MHIKKSKGNGVIYFECGLAWHVLLTMVYKADAAALKEQTKSTTMGPVAMLKQGAVFCPFVFF